MQQIVRKSQIQIVWFKIPYFFIAMFKVFGKVFMLKHSHMKVENKQLNGCTI